MSRDERSRSTSTVPQLLTRMEEGERAAVQELAPRLYGELKEIAHALMRGQRSDHTLQTTALVHEAYLRMVGNDKDSSAAPRRFLALAATAMRSVLLDMARARRTLKRSGGQAIATPLDEIAHCKIGSHRLFEIADAISWLEGKDPELARVAELRILGGMEHAEIAATLDCSTRTAERRWRLARALLERSLELPEEEGSR